MNFSMVFWVSAERPLGKEIQAIHLVLDLTLTATLKPNSDSNTNPTGGAMSLYEHKFVGLLMCISFMKPEGTTLLGTQMF